MTTNRTIFRRDLRRVAAMFALATSPFLLPSQSRPEPKLPDTVLFGAAYYDEYTPNDRLEQDIALMKAAHITIVRIAESTWGTEEPEEGRFDFSHIDRVLNAMDKAGIKVIVGTLTYAVPTWLAREHPDDARLLRRTDFDVLIGKATLEGVKDMATCPGEFVKPTHFGLSGGIEGRNDDQFV